jgi:hypothetical protein
MIIQLMEGMSGHVSSYVGPAMNGKLDPGQTGEQS